MRKWLKTLKDPDDIGSAEYRCIHQVVKSAIEDGADKEHVIEILNEFQFWSRSFKLQMPSPWKQGGLSSSRLRPSK
jgi:hypothetical protein